MRSSKETLKELCKGCEYSLSLAKQCCPFRSISNDYCDEYNSLLKDLEVLEILLASLLKKPITNGTDSNKMILLDSQSYDRIKKLLEKSTPNTTE